MTMPTPIKPTPTSMPALNALAGCMRKIIPTKKKMIGIITAEPSPKIVLMISMKITCLF